MPGNFQSREPYLENSRTKAYYACSRWLVGYFFRHRFSFLSPSLSGRLIELTGMLSQRAIKPKISNQPIFRSVFNSRELPIYYERI